MKHLISILFLLLALNACQVINVTNDYNKLNEDEIRLVSDLKDFDQVIPGHIYVLNAKQLKTKIKNDERSLVYVFVNGCTSTHCLPMASYENFARTNGYTLYLVMAGFGNIQSTLKQNIESPLYAINAAYYNTKYLSKYVRYFENDLMDLPLNTSFKERKMNGNLYFYEKGVLDTVMTMLPTMKSITQ